MPIVSHSFCSNVNDRKDALSLENMLRDLEKSVQKMKLGEDIDMDALQTLYNLITQEMEEEMKKVLGDRLAKLKVGIILKKFWKLQGKARQHTILIQRVCWRYAHVSEELCEHFGNSGYLQVLITHLNVLTVEENAEALTSLMGIVMNCAKILSNAKYFKSKEIVESIYKCTKCKDQRVRMMAILTLAHVVDEEYNYLITADESMIKSIIKLLKDSIKNAQHESRGWCALELVNGLLQLANNEENNVAIVKEGVIGTLISLMENGNEKEQNLAGEALWMLCFNEMTKHALLKNACYMEALHRLEKADIQGRNAISGILWLLKSKVESDSIPTSAESQTKNNRIMISYQWDNQEVIDWVYEELTKRGYCVWMDNHHMRGSIMDGMAEAVQDSQIILVCMTQKYKNSPNCKTEAEYAFKLRKTLIPLRLEQGYKASGWLSLILGTRMYTDFSKLSHQNDETFQKAISKLVVEIDYALNDCGVRFSAKCAEICRKNEQIKCMEAPNGCAAKDLSDGNDSKPMASKDPAPKQCRNIDPDVEKWMARNQVSSHKLAGLSMEELKFLKELMVKAPEVFYNFLSNKLLKKDLVEMMKISNALRSL